MSFADLGLLKPLVHAVTAQGYDQPSPIQQKAIPAVLSGRDIMAAAQTGTGKTAGFSLPMLQKLLVQPVAKSNQVRALVLVPTRELAAQVAESLKIYGEGLTLRSDVVFGGVKINPQMMRLRRGADVLVATPGRLLDLYQQNAIRFDRLEFLVFDEADRMLDMGFIHDIRKILKLVPQKRQTLMFSATFSPEIRELAKTIVRDPVEIDVSPRNTTAVTIDQWIYPVDKRKKPEALEFLLKEKQVAQVLVFSRTKHGANRLATRLINAGFAAAAIHGDKSQGARTRALAGFKSGELQILVATDIAARGLDIQQLPLVINVDLPNVAEDYVHRIGRTGRAGEKGQAVSLVSADEHDYLYAIESLIQKELPREFLGDYYPDHQLPESKPLKAPKPKKPKKPKKSKVATTQTTDQAPKRAATKKPRRSTSQSQPSKKAKFGDGLTTNRKRSPRRKPKA